MIHKRIAKKEKKIKREAQMENWKRKKKQS